MIASSPHPSTAGDHHHSQALTHNKALRMVKNPRMGGFVPAWSSESGHAKNVQSSIENALGQASQPDSAGSMRSAFADPSAHTAPSDHSSSRQQESFGFGDLLDMINPLHHIPVVGHLYRSFTGDTIKPIGQIVGGALFGGPVGAGVSLVKAVIEDGTGEPVSHTLSQAFMPSSRPDDVVAPEIVLSQRVSFPESKKDSAQQETSYTQDPHGASQITAPLDDLPVSLLAFTDQSLFLPVKISRV